MQAESDTQEQNSESEMSSGIRRLDDESHDVTIDAPESERRRPSWSQQSAIGHAAQEFGRVLNPAMHAPVIVNLDQGSSDPDL